MNTNRRKIVGQNNAALFIIFLVVASAPRANAQGGIPVWTNRYNGSGNGDDSPYGIAADGSGNVFVTGLSPAGIAHYGYATVAYSSAGVPLWTNRYEQDNTNNSARAVAADSNGNVFVTGDSQYSDTGGIAEYTTLAYSCAGVLLWENRYGLVNGNSDALALTVEGSGNVIVTGQSANGVDNDWATIKYSGAGVPLWTNRYGGPPNSDDSPVALALDSSGNVIVTGRSAANGIVNDWATVKYSSAGVPLWTNQYDGPAYGDDQARGVALDRDDNVFVSGVSPSNGGQYEQVTIKYSNAGMPLWTNRSAYSSCCSGIAVDSNGNVFLAGLATIKLSGAGVPAWTNYFGGNTVAMAVDSRGNVFVTGAGFGPNYDFITIAYSNSGLPLWTNRYEGPAGGTDAASALALDSGGNILVTGVSWNGSNYDYATVKYSATVPPVHLSIEPDGSGGLFVRYTGAPDVTYRLQRTPNLTGPWSDLATNIAPASGLIEYHDTSPLPGQAFYRAVLP